MPFLDILQASVLNAILHKHLRHISIMPTSPTTTYSQFYEVCKSFPDDQWISVLAAFTTVVAGFPSPAEVQLNVLAQPNPMHTFAYVIASRQVTTIHYFLRMSTRMVQCMTQWDGQNFATDMDWTDMGVRTVALLPNLFNCATPILVLVEVEEGLQYFDNNPQSDYMPAPPAGLVHPGNETVLSG